METFGKANHHYCYLGPGWDLKGGDSFLILQTAKHLKP